uniref:Cytochrome c biogenesis protein CcsA n=11 Tax=Isoetes TaxID=13838 RepID=A0A3G2BWM9_9TRAC|nr:cytochrome c heme attachment protein [Isoetes flaccida]YP_009498650.1 cytochrome c heme attachment protein [Isoetes butleri]YP_009498902.1 cytochrome c heme attachment protein [Isoetes valida]AWF83652.1 cytochrome c heme attachment protein [Isoetes flaccida var. chapmanii]AWK91668.1 cytochrome c heme attachment protein [Isoetes flaccida var. flaccida]AWK91752.1 cytochrome c heme attachment protein [Isoetes lithophila]AWK91836.1 cytochrome c heme attachment protein [Isoetes melanopoda subsp
MILRTLEHILAHTSFFLLFSVTLLYWGKLVYIRNKKLSNLGRRSVIITFICITGFLLTRWLYSGHLPLSNLYESSMFLSWSFCLIHTVLIRSQNDWLGTITAPSAMLTHGFATLSVPREMQQSTVLVPALQSHWLMMHVSMMMFSYATLLCGSLLAIALLVITSKNNMDTPIITSGIDSSIWSSSSEKSNERGECDSPNTPFLLSINSREDQLTQQLDHWSYRIISLGSPLLTLGILSGAVWANEAWGYYWNWDPKETWASITWLMFATYMHTRVTKSWRGKEPAIVASLGFFTTWICYLGVNPSGKGLHSHGWLN